MMVDTDVGFDEARDPGFIVPIRVSIRPHAVSAIVFSMSGYGATIRWS
jgi:hypothetical protein